MDRGKEMLTSIKVRQYHIALIEDGRLRVELQTKETYKYFAHLEAQVTRHQGELKEAQA